jgi:phosphoribosylglycinamide formyltransferase-1
VGVLASGRGTNLQAILDAIDAGRCPARVVVVVSDRPEAAALDRARRAAIEAVHVDPQAVADRGAFDQAIAAVLAKHDVELVCLAGYMRVLSPGFVAAYRHRILNVHPALLPAFPGTTSVADALAGGVKVTGVTVHLVDDEVDHGPIVFQEALPVLPGDDWDALEARVHEVEHRLLPAAVRALAEGRVVVDGRVARVLEEAPA